MPVTIPTVEFNSHEEHNLWADFYTAALEGGANNVEASNRADKGVLYNRRRSNTFSPSQRNAWLSFYIAALVGGAKYSDARVRADKGIEAQASRTINLPGVTIEGEDDDEVTY